MNRALVPLLGAAASGVLLLLALPPVGIWQFGWLCFVPLFASVRGRGFLMGFVAGILSCLLTAWLAAEGVFYGAAPGEGDPGWIYTGCFLFGFATAITAGVAAEAKRRGILPVLGLASLATLLEAVLLTILPAHLALTQWQVPGMMLLASVAGIWGVSFLLWAVNIFLADAIHSRNWKAAVVCGGVFASTALLGVLPYRSAPADLKVALVQTPENDPAKLGLMTMSAAAQGAEVVVWPEFAGYVMAPGGDAKEILELTRDVPGVTIVTSFADNHRPLPHNVAAAFSNGKESARYFKRQLFGAEKDMHTPGERPAVSDLAGRKLGLNICFDSCYPFVLRDTARAADVDLIALPTIDPNSPYHFIAAIHAAYTPFRAAELGTPVARADGYAFSMVVDHTGRVVKALPAKSDQIAVVEVAAGSHFTLYKALGDWFLYLCGAVFLAAMWPSRKKQRNDEEAEQPGTLAPPEPIGAKS